MSAYLIVSTKVIQTEGWGPYQSKVGECFISHGARYLAMRQIPEVLEGTSPHDRVTIFEFPSMDAIRGLWTSAEYTELRKLRKGLGDLDIVALPGIS